MTIAAVSECREDWLVRDQFRIAPVSDLPYAHNPPNCTHFDEAFDKSAEWDGVEGRRFFESLSAEQLASCYYHQLADWRAVAEASVRLFSAHQNRPVSDLWGAIEADSRVPRRDHDQLYWLFADPIVWGGEATIVVNGQHRLCAIRASGAPLCVIDHNGLSQPRDVRSQ